MRGLRDRGPGKARYVVSDDRKSLREAIPQELPEAAWQRCYPHCIRNARNRPAKRLRDSGCLHELKLVHERVDMDDARKELARWLSKRGEACPKLAERMGGSIDETLMFCDLPGERGKRMRTTNTLERMNREIRRRTRIARVFPNEESCLRLAGAVLVEMHEDWLTGNRFLSMTPLREQMREEAGERRMAA